MKKFVLLSLFAILALSLLVAADGQKGSWTGWVSDAHCGAKGNSAGHADCAAKCITGGAKAVLVVGEDVFAIANQDSVKAHAGHNVKVTGSLDKDKKVVTVEKVEMMGGK